MLTGHSLDKIQEIYTGEFKYDSQHGVGRYETQDGHEYEGEWVSDEQHGFGIYRFPDGSSYCGEWKLGKPDGIGIWENANIRHFGKWVSGKREGLAFVTSKRDNSVIFEGIYVNDKPAS
eukprot:TRINITY_DN7261_c0_g1_i1.p1 TRINITY_DN7261_c0_g1~~TRINITY_DN7261_c0_g1_i1.p1  ORF type:complete len:119 (-),score=22.55 TRINITY_DN7261_c0_g1_i1:28-384(-)